MELNGKCFKGMFTMSCILFLLLTLLNSANSKEVNLTTPLDDFETCSNSTCMRNNNDTDIISSKNFTSSQTTTENEFERLNYTSSDNFTDNGTLYEGSGFERSKKELIHLDDKRRGDESPESFDESDDMAHTFTSHIDEFNKFHTLEVLLESSENETELSTSTEAGTVTANVTEKTVTTTVPSVSKVPTPSESFFFKNYQNDTLICSCDLTINQCDINCCCDKECSTLHWKVFTKCNDADSQYDSQYCFKNNFVFSNNTNSKVIQNEGGLFCIVRDNSRLAFHYKSKEIMRTLEAFNRSLPKGYYSFSKEATNLPKFETKNYKAEQLIWIIENGQMKPFGVPTGTVGVLCNSLSYAKYLMDQTTVCSHKRPQYEFKCGNSKTRNVLNYLRDIKIISNPSLVNKSLDIAKICQGKTCLKIIPYICKPHDTFDDCGKAPVRGNILAEVICWYTVPRIQYRIWHNGSEGITKFEAFIWLRNVSFVSGKSLLQTTEVKFYWAGGSVNVFERSGNPGYLTGKPLLAGRKVFHVINETGVKKEAIEMSISSDTWLNILGSEKGICSSRKRIPIKFRENGQFKCSLGLTKDNFDKNECVELQNNIFKLLIGDDVMNVTNDNLYNKFVATFGNSKVEETGDWVQVLIDSFPLISSQVGFKSNHDSLICKNMITDLIVDIAYSNIGSFLNPQSKVLGVSFQFGSHRDLTFYCDTRGCEYKTSVQYFKLSTSVNFIDLTEPALDAFAKPLGLEVKLPHDFFYPFFSKSSTFQVPNLYVFVLPLLALL